MLGGCLGLVAVFIGLALMAVAMWEYPPGLLLLPIAFFVGRRAWRKHLGRAQAEAQATRDDDDVA